MDLKIITAPLQLNIHGFSGIAVNRDYAGTAFKLMDRMWKTVKENKLKNKGLNIWIYEQDHAVFAGVELDGDQNAGLEQKNIVLSKYAWYKHIGPYDLIKQAGNNMRAELKNRGLVTELPYVEIYGHWTNDESRLETELLMCLQ